MNDVVINDGNNAVAEAGETIGLDISFNNVGSVDATNLTATLTTESYYITLVNGTATLPIVPSNQSIEVEDAFTLQISPMIPDETQVAFQIQITDGNDVWTSNRNFTVNAPNIVFSDVNIQDGNNNGFYESGETLLVTVSITNDGHMAGESGDLQLVVNPAQATLAQDSFVLPPVGVGSIVPVTFQLFLADGLADGTVVALGYL